MLAMNYNVVDFLSRSGPQPQLLTTTPKTSASLGWAALSSSSRVRVC